MSSRDTPPTNGTPLGIAIKSAGKNASIIELIGELDMGTVPQVEGRLRQALEANDGVILDLSDLSFIDSTGIGLLIDAHQATEGSGKLHTVISPNSQIERVFRIAGIDRALPTFSDREEAISALAPLVAKQKAQRVRAA
jgi:anti-sigma B factor antagonist